MSDHVLDSRNTSPDQFLKLVLIDPVCRSDVRMALIDKSLPRPVSLLHEGTHYMFCSDVCRREFELNPRRYMRVS